MLEQHPLKHSLWVNKYRPSTIEEYIFQDPQQQAVIMNMITNKSIPHILLSGAVGSGKTTLAFILINEMNIDELDVRVINASDENSVDTVREKIRDFVSTAPIGDYKIVLLEEADYISQNGQAVMRRLMEEFSDDARFILTCNYVHKIIPAIRSRCTTKLHFKAANRYDIAEYLIKVLAAEKIQFNLDLLEKFITAQYPDIRGILGALQQYSINGVLIDPANDATNSADYKFTLIDLIQNDNWIEARKLICENVLAEEYEDVYRFLYENIGTSKKFSKRDKWEEAIVIIAQYLYKHSAVADAEINFAAMMIELGNL